MTFVNKYNPAILSGGVIFIFYTLPLSAVFIKRPLAKLKKK
jgi:hypothetical protein